MVGIREISRDLQFSSSYTLVEHAPVNSIETEIKPIAMAAVEKVKTALATNDFTELFRILGISEEVELLRSDETVTDPEHTSSEHTVVEAVLKADSTGYWVKHPFVNSHLQRTLARWAFKLCTAGGFTLPAFALADDGYLVLHDGKIYSGSDWIPEWKTLTSLNSKRMLVVRYPIRTEGDLLPVEALDDSATLELLMRHLERQKCSMDSAAANEIVDRQLRLEGTLTLNSETAKKNGGDYDFDWICVVEGTRLPLFVEDRFRHTPAGENTKNKQSKKESPWWNLPQVAYSAKGNAIGAITDLKTSCLAAGRPDLAHRCAMRTSKGARPAQVGSRANKEEIGKIRQERHRTMAQAPSASGGFPISRLQVPRPRPIEWRIVQPRSERTLRVLRGRASTRRLPRRDCGSLLRPRCWRSGRGSTMLTVNIGLLAEKQQRV